uniref:Distal membrane arm assembly complex 2-like protein n=1 Tax=Tetradesmus obliquus TaxID=3088 RepID=A0A383V9C3_TETOB|eukprot:jgi/Sobl393_1/17174/SZX61771.1
MPPEFAMRLCGGLTGLRGLRVLSLRSVHLAPGDVLALTALTGLTRLEFVDMCKIGEVQAAAHAIIRSLKHLKCLRMQSCHVDLSSTELLAAVGQLKQLTCLRLLGNVYGDGGVTEQGLMQLTGLSRLEQLDVNKNEEVNEQVLGSFWAAMRQQQQ